MKKYFIAKQGLELKIFSVILQNLIISPIFLILTFFIASIIRDYINVDPMFIFKIIFIALNVLWIIRNSIVKVYDDIIIYKSLIGTKRVIEINEIFSLQLLTAKEYRKKILNSSYINPVRTNCLSILIPMKNILFFKNKYNREITFGVWNYRKLFNILNEKLNCSAESSEISKNIQGNIHNQSVFKIWHFLKMPFGYHLILFFKHWADTIFFPAFITLFTYWLLEVSDIRINKYVLIVLFITISLLLYFKVIRVIIDDDLKIIRINYFISNNKNVIKYNNLKNLHYLSSISEFENIKRDTSKINIITPFYKNYIKDVIVFELDNNIRVVLSVSNSQKVYEILEQSICD